MCAAGLARLCLPHVFSSPQSFPWMWLTGGWTALYTSQAKALATWVPGASNGQQHLIPLPPPADWRRWAVPSPGTSRGHLRAGPGTGGLHILPGKGWEKSDGQSLSGPKVAMHLVQHQLGWWPTLEVQGEGLSTKATLASQSAAPADHVLDDDNSNTLKMEIWC